LKRTLIFAVAWPLFVAIVIFSFPPAQDFLVYTVLTHTPPEITARVYPRSPATADSGISYDSTSPDGTVRRIAQ